jgi:hypothetical protein
MNSNSSRLLLAGTISAILAGCGGGGGSSMSTTPAAQTGNVAVMVSDASTEDWATIGVKILSIALVPQGGGPNVTIYTAPTTVPVTNLVNLDNLSDILGNATITTTSASPVVFTGAIITLSANPGDVMLTAAADPETGFEGVAGQPVPMTDIQIQNVQGTAPNLTVPVNITLDSPLQVNPGQAASLDVEFDLSHPAFIIAHNPPALQGTTIWAVDFNGPVRHHPVKDLTRLVLRHMYGQVASISQDNTSITINKELPLEPPTNPETPVATGQTLTILADATNGTLLYDIDTQTRTTITSFANLSTLAGAQVRIAARYQADGTLVATRIYESSATNAFNNVWLSPEGHVLHVNATTDVVTIENELGQGVPVTVGPDTKFYYRQPWNALADETPIGVGPSFLTNEDFVRGFKVHLNVANPLSDSWVAESVDIEYARYDGVISAPSTTGFTYTRTFHTASDDYTYTLDYISATTPNGNDPLSGDPIEGYKWWYFAYPTVLDLSVGDWVSVSNGDVNLGGTVGALPTYGVSRTLWNDPANPNNAWSANASIVMPTLMPLGANSSGLSAGNTFTLTVPNGSVAATIDVSTATGGATLVYQVDRTNDVVTVSQIDVTTPAGLAALTTALQNTGTPVRVYGVPQLDGSMKAYVLTYFTGTIMPAL